MSNIKSVRKNTRECNLPEVIKDIKLLISNKHKNIKSIIKLLLLEKLGMISPIIVASYFLNMNLPIPRVLKSICQLRRGKENIGDFIMMMSKLFIYPLEDWEPWPIKQQEMISKLNADSFKTAASLYWRGMDPVFWFILRDSVISVKNNENTIKLLKILEAESYCCPQDNKISKRYVPMIWVFALCFVYLKKNDQLHSPVDSTTLTSILKQIESIWTFKNLKNFKNFKNFGNIKKWTESGIGYRPPVHDKYSQYFNIGIKRDIIFLAPGQEIQPIVKYSDISIRDTPDDSIKLHEFGTLQCIYESHTYGENYPIICWLRVEDSIKKYVIRTQTMKKNAKEIVNVDLLMNKCPLFECPISKIICLTQTIEHLGVFVQSNRVADTNTDTNADTNCDTNDSGYDYLTDVKPSRQYKSMPNVYSGNIRNKKVYGVLAECASGIVMSDCPIVVRNAKYVFGAQNRGKFLLSLKSTNKQIVEKLIICDNMINNNNNNLESQEIGEITQNQEFANWLYEFLDICSVPVDTYIRARILLSHYNL